MRGEESAVLKLKTRLSLNRNSLKCFQSQIILFFFAEGNSDDPVEKIAPTAAVLFEQLNCIIRIKAIVASDVILQDLMTPELAM